MLSREGKQTDRGAVGAEFIGYNRRRREALLLQEFPHQPNCRPSVPAGLNQEIQDFALTVHGTPEIELPPSNYDDHLVQVPAFGRSWPPTLNPPRIGPTEFQDPSSNCLIRDVETTLGKQVLNVPIAQRETAIEPDGMLDDDRWKAVTTVGYLPHPETLKHRPCRSHAVNVTMPSSVVMNHVLRCSGRGDGRIGTPRNTTASRCGAAARARRFCTGCPEIGNPDKRGRRNSVVGFCRSCSVYTKFRFKPRWKSNYLGDWSIHLRCTSILNWSCGRIYNSIQIFSGGYWKCSSRRS